MATGIMANSEGVTIPLEMLDVQGEGIAVLTVAPGAYLIVRSEKLTVYPGQRLLEFSRMAQALERLRPKEGIPFTLRKQRALRELSQQGYSVFEEMQPTIRQVKQPVGVEVFPLPQRIKEISERVKIIRFGIVYETTRSPWDRLAGMFTVSRPVNIEEMLDARGFEETADYL